MSASTATGQAALVELPAPHLLFLGAETDPFNAKTAFGLRDWRPEVCLGQWALPGGSVDLGLPPLAPRQAVEAGARSVVIGIAPFGGTIEAGWVAPLQTALEAGLDIVSGMHTRLAEVPALREAALRHGRRLVDVRHVAGGFTVASGRRRSGMRLLTVGTDCALGKKYTALALTRAIVATGGCASFRATGQTGIMIAGGGVPLDAVVSDFIAGAAEVLSPDNHPEHWDVIEGQGSILHPAYAGVSLGLLHGSQPDALVLCHDPRRSEIQGYDGFAIPPLPEVMDLHLRLARRTNPQVRFVGASLNTSGMTEQERSEALALASTVCGVPAFDPIATDLRPLLGAMGLA